MYIGVISMLKNHVEEVVIEAENVEEAQDKLASYVYHNYNKKVPIDGYLYSGVVIDTSVLKTIGEDPLIRELDKLITA